MKTESSSHFGSSLGKFFSCTKPLVTICAATESSSYSEEFEFSLLSVSTSCTAERGFFSAEGTTFASRMKIWKKKFGYSYISQHLLHFGSFNVPPDKCLQESIRQRRNACRVFLIIQAAVN